MIPVNQATEIHKTLIDTFGGSPGVLDLAALESALARPFQTFDGMELYPHIVAKAAALLESLLINHPFVDGNKRTAYVMMRLLLLSNGYDIIASQDEKYGVIINIAAGKYSFDQIVDWLNGRVVKST
jgi:death-on-curing protein